MKYLSIDYGMRRIGIAASDPLGIIVRPVYTIDRKHEDTFSVLSSLISEEKPEKIIFGLPLDYNNEETSMCAKVRRFADRMYTELSLDSIPFEFHDEALSSVKSRPVLQANYSRKKRKNKKNIDKIAACIFLEEYLREL
jgi:putative Holliday junction resolvase